MFSRFGVMTFNDPVAAFANFRRILRPSGALAFACWRSLQENELDHLPLLQRDSIGFDESPFSFRRPRTIVGPLRRLGWARLSSILTTKRCRAAISTR